MACNCIEMSFVRMDMKKVYLACPFSHPDPCVMQDRLDAANETAAVLMMQGYNIFSPLSHSVPIVEAGAPDGYEFWLSQDLPLIAWCDTLAVMCLPGWELSKGVAAEIAEAKRLGKEIVYMNQ